MVTHQLETKNFEKCKLQSTDTQNLSSMQFLV